MTSSSRRSPPIAVPLPQRLALALDRHDTLTSLSARMAESRARLTAVLEALPSTLHGHVRPGPLDEEGWSVLVSNAAIAAKLRQLLPRLQTTLRDRGWPERVIRIRISRQAGSPP